MPASAANRVSAIPSTASIFAASWRLAQVRAAVVLVAVLPVVALLAVVDEPVAAARRDHAAHAVDAGQPVVALAAVAGAALGPGDAAAGRLVPGRRVARRRVGRRVPGRRVAAVGRVGRVRLGRARSVGRRADRTTQSR